MVRYKLTLLLVSVIYMYPLTVQSLDFQGQREAGQLWRLIQQVYQRLDTVLHETHAMNDVNKVLLQACDVEHPDSKLAHALRAEADQVKKNRGLSIRGAYTTKSLTENEGDPSAYLELSWDVWRQGYLGNRQQARELGHQARIAGMRAQVEQQKLTYRCRRYKLSQTFTGLLSRLLSLKLELMEPVYRIEKRAYFKSWSYLDDLLVSEQDIYLLRKELKNLNSDPYWDNALKQALNLPVIDVDIDAVIALIRKDDTQQRIGLLEKQLIREKNSYRDRDRLRLFLRKEFAVGGSSNNDGVVAGVRFTIPLEKKHKQQRDFRLAYVDQKTELSAWERVTRTRAAYQSLNEQMQRVIKQQYRYLRAHERVRRSLVEKKLDHEVQLAAAVTRLRAVLDAGIELVRSKEELYRRVNEVFLVSRVDFNPDLIQLNSLQTKKYRARPGERSIYLWSRGFNQYSNEQIFDFLEAKGISRVLLSAGKAVEREKMKRFISEAKNKKIKIESIIGNNNWTFTKHHKGASLAVSAAMTVSGAVHLDIEPHTFAEYKKNRASYLKQYLAMIKQIRKVSTDESISVAVPVHWPATVYAELDSSVNGVYVMAYGSDKPDVVIRRLQKVLENISNRKIVIVLRVSDFADEWALENMIAALQQRTGVQRYGLHTFRTFIKKAGAE